MRQQVCGQELHHRRVAALLVLLFSIPAFAQLPTGTILGTVKDPSGAVVPGATVTSRNVDTSFTRTVTTDEGGAYRIPALPVGRYAMKFEKAGFQTQMQQGSTLEVSQELVVNASLSVGASSQEVVVSAEAPMVNTTSSSLGGLVNEAKMADLPLNGRNFIDLSLMQPGVTNDANYGDSAAQGGTNGIWFSSNGAPVRSNNFTLDGAMLMNQRGTTSNAVGVTLGVDGIREYKVITNAFSAEYGMTMGSQTVVVSKGGSNQFHGDGFEYLRNSVLDARNYFDYGYLKGQGRLPEFRRNNFGGAFGGPIRKDKTFFYGVYEGLRQALGASIIDPVIPANCHTYTSNPCATQSGGTVAPVMRPLLDLYPSPNIAGTNNFTYPSINPTRVDYGQMRMDQNVSATDTFFARYTVEDSFNTTYRGAKANAGGYPQVRTGTQGRDQFITLSENHIFGPALLNTARFSYSRTNLRFSNLYSQDLTGPQYSFVAGKPIGDIIIGGGAVAAFGPNTLFPQYAIQNLYTLSDDLFYTHGRHALKFGTLINRFTEPIDLSSNSTGSVTFASTAAFLAGVPANYTSLTPGSNLNRNFIYDTLGFYLQDDWRTTSRLTLNLGLRYEFNTTPTEINGRGWSVRNVLTDTAPTAGPVMANPSLHNFSPRLGFAYDVTGKGKTSVRGAYGMYYDIGNIGFALEQAPQATPPLSSTSAVTNTAGKVLTLPFTYTTPANSLHTVDYNAKQPYVLQYNLTVEQQLPANVALSVSYVGSRGIHLWNSLEGNVCVPTSVTNGIPFWSATASCPNGRQNPAWGSVLFHTTKGDSYYNSMQVVLSKRLSRGLEFQSTYTWGKSLDDTQGQGLSGDCVSAGSAEGEYPLDAKHFDKGPSCFDVTQNWRFNLLYHLPNLHSNNFAAKLLKGWWMGNLVSVNSGYPFTPMVGAYRSNSANMLALQGISDRANLNTSGGTATIKGVSYNFVPYDKNSVITGDPAHWFNPLMFSLGPVGYLGNASRDMLRGPGLMDWDFSINKDTALPLLGEAGKLEFRAEMFNILNHVNFGMPNGTVFAGTLADGAGFSEAPNANAGQIVNTITTSRQIQFALRLVF